MSRLMRKPTKWHPPSLIRVFAVCMKKACVLSYPLNAEWRLIRLGIRPGLSESSLGAQIILLVLSWGSSDIEDKTSSLHQAELHYNSKHPDAEMIFGHFLCVLSCRHNSVDINVAVATDAGLITPIVFRADNKVRFSWPMLEVSLTHRGQWRLRRVSVQSPQTLHCSHTATEPRGIFRQRYTFDLLSGLARIIEGSQQEWIQIYLFFFSHVSN